MDKAFTEYKKRMLTTNIITSIAIIFLFGFLIAAIWAVVTFPLLLLYLNKKSKNKTFINNLKSKEYQKKPKKMFRYFASSFSLVLLGFFLYNSLAKNGWTEIDPFKIIVLVLFILSWVWLIRTIRN